LESISSSQHNNFEIIAVDDASADNQSIADLPNTFSSLNLRVVRINKNAKWWVNPCMPNNIGFAVASGDVFIIQNPECLHMGDIISYTAKHMLSNKYIAFGCYALDNNKTRQVVSVNGGATEELLKIISPTNDVLLEACPSMNRWYQHSKYSDRCLNFCTAISREDLEDLGGFDEEYAEGISYDDTEFIARVRKKGMDVGMVDNPFVLHQWHPPSDYSNKRLVQRNTDLYFNKTVPSDNFRVRNEHTKSLIDKMKGSVK
jgi:GT2 family glycosyltransferase